MVLIKGPDQEPAHVVRGKGWFDVHKRSGCKQAGTFVLVYISVSAILLDI